ncbi:MAG: 50S ribosomal protein L29 [Patescibacteria group bacterium]
MKDFIKKNKKELTTLLGEKRKALSEFRFSLSGSNSRNVKEGTKLKTEIAQILTVLNSKTK